MRNGPSDAAAFSSFGHSIITQHRKVLLHFLSSLVIMVSVVVSGDTEEGGEEVKMEGTTTK